jgi:hypothetical protein
LKVLAPTTWLTRWATASESPPSANSPPSRAHRVDAKKGDALHFNPLRDFVDRRQPEGALPYAKLAEYPTKMSRDCPFTDLQLMSNVLDHIASCHEHGNFMLAPG